MEYGTAHDSHTNPGEAASLQTVLLMMGSTRADRLCPVLATWVAGIARSSAGIGCEVVDLADWPLPMDDEPGIPAPGGYVCAHTRAWSEKIAGADAFVFVTLQYNWGYPAPLKNAFDHLYVEWVASARDRHIRRPWRREMRKPAQAGCRRAEDARDADDAWHHSATRVIRGAPIDTGVHLADQVGPVRQDFAELHDALAEAALPSA